MFVEIILPVSVSLVAILVGVCVAAGMLYICKKKKTTQTPSQSAAQTTASAKHTLTQLPVSVNTHTLTLTPKLTFFL